MKERFKNFENDFTYEGYYRNSDKGKTLIKLKCKKCNLKLEKCQNLLLKRNKTLFCFGCKGYKKARPLDYTEITKEFEDNGCTIYKIENCKVIGLCLCGDEFEKNIHGLKHYNCITCSLKNRVFKNSYNEVEVRRWFIDNGLTPIFDKYKNANSDLDYICLCGKKSHIRYSRRFEHDANWKPMCKSCAMSKKTSGENHWKWVSGYKYTSKRYPTEKTWSRKVKKGLDIDVASQIQWII